MGRPMTCVDRLPQRGDIIRFDDSVNLGELLVVVLVHNRTVGVLPYIGSATGRQEPKLLNYLNTLRYVSRYDGGTVTVED